MAFVDTPYANIIVAFVILLNLVLRIFDFEESFNADKSAQDPFSQLSLAIVASQQSSICPIKESYNQMRGRQFYPVGAFLIAYHLVNSINWLNQLFNLNEHRLSSFLRQKNRTLDNYIIFFKVTSGIIFPILAQALFALIFFKFYGSNSTLIVSILFVSAIITIDSLFEKSRYSVSTRNTGLFLYSIYSCSIIYTLKGGINALISINAFIFCLVYLGVFISIFFVSQRYKCFVVTTFVLCMAAPHYAHTY